MGFIHELQDVQINDDRVKLFKTTAHSLLLTSEELQSLSIMEVLNVN